MCYYLERSKVLLYIRYLVSKNLNGMGSRMFMLAMLESNLRLFIYHCEQAVFSLILLVIYMLICICVHGVSVNKGFIDLFFALVSSTLLWTIPHLFHIFCLSILVDYLETLFKIPKMNNHVAYFMLSTHYCLQLQQACHLSHYTIFLKILKLYSTIPRLVMILDILYLEILMGPNSTWGY